METNWPVLVAIVVIPIAIVLVVKIRMELNFARRILKGEAWHRLTLDEAVTFVSNLFGRGRFVDVSLVVGQAVSSKTLREKLRSQIPQEYSIEVSRSLIWYLGMENYCHVRVMNPKKQ